VTKRERPEYVLGQWTTEECENPCREHRLLRFPDVGCRGDYVDGFVWVRGTRLHRTPQLSNPYLWISWAGATVLNLHEDFLELSIWRQWRCWWSARVIGMVKGMEYGPAFEFRLSAPHSSFISIQIRIAMVYCWRLGPYLDGCECWFGECGVDNRDDIRNPSCWSIFRNFDYMWVRVFSYGQKQMHIGAYKQLVWI